MKKDSTVMDNFNIGVFMELERSNLLPYSFIVEGASHTAGELQYHTSWDWLMPVVEKIKEYGKWTLQPGEATLELYRELAGYGNIRSKRIRFSTSQMDWETENDEPVEWIFMVHHIVLKFINWYNTQKQ